MFNYCNSINFAYIFNLLIKMEHIKNLDNIPQDLNLMAGIDICGNFRRLFSTPNRVSAYLFLLCIRGNCKVNLHLSQYTMKPGSLLIILSDLYFQIIEQSKDCRFMFVGFATDLIRCSNLFTKTLEYTPDIFERPLIQLNKKAESLLATYIKLLIKAKNISGEINKEQASLSYTQLILGLSNSIINSKCQGQQYNRNHEIVKELVRIVVMNYQTERNVGFYADKMHLSPQHLSTTIKKITGKTLTDIISSFIINDAKAKLKSSEMTIQEIAYSLNFPDISFFGKYFKRYTGMSPKLYRNSHL